jgi:hypothetical protein
MFAIGTQMEYLSEFRDVFGMRFVGLADPGDTVYGDWRVPQPTAPYPQDYVIDQQGVVRYWSDQFDPWEVIATIDRLLATGIAEDDSRLQIPDHRLQILSNPTSGLVRARFAPGADAITVFDACGRVRLSRAVGPAATDAELDLAGLAAGVYVIRLSRPRAEGRQPTAERAQVVVRR